MHVTCAFYATVRDAVGAKEIEREAPEGATVRDVLDALAAEYDGVGPLVFDSEGRVRANVNVLVNGENVRDGAGPATALSDGDTLMVAPAVAGG
ncbi:ubiquitin-like small modifier protein 1 [Halosegnis marinus]|uniref:Ubiquitin-like small modifier protein 1 n=1 Tax=Halosegnis marinus TaxID=3034023 RepID=A0ABD5ZJT8_9EURY|nr:ubiquitin-like small modifier protein 1 [Halosegnis sp. DT85]